MKISQITHRDHPGPQSKQSVPDAAAAFTGPDIGLISITGSQKGLNIQAARPTVKSSTSPPAKSGVRALDRNLSDANDEDEVLTERAEEDEEWDLIEADGEEGNWARG